MTLDRAACVFADDGRGPSGHCGDADPVQALMRARVQARVAGRRHGAGQGARMMARVWGRGPGRRPWCLEMEGDSGGLWVRGACPVCIHVAPACGPCSAFTLARWEHVLNYG
ncbi:hypothetical protein TSOC_001125, partial [Tetrabaena socialis]